jgi:hypothetical protein
MAHKSSRTKIDRESPPENAWPAWRLPEGAVPAEPHGRRSRWLLALAIFLQVAWIVALAAMAVFVRWKK